MHIKHTSIFNFRALQTVSIPFMHFSVILGENDVGKSSILYSLDAFFQNKKISDPGSFFKRDISKNIKIELTFDNPPDNQELKKLKISDGTIVITKDFAFDKSPVVESILDGDSKCDVKKDILNNWFSANNFHFIPVRRDLNVQFSMNKTALLGKTFRTKMKSVIERGDASESLQNL